MDEQRDFYRPTPRLSVEGTREILEELKHGPKDTPERRATLKRAAAWNETIDRLFSSERKHATDKDQR
jgi:hypothetical protein